MSLEQLLPTLHSKNIRIGLKQGNLVIEAPKGVMTAAIKAQLVSLKPELMNWLKDSDEKLTQSLPSFAPDPDNGHQVFPLSDLQTGFYMAADDFMEFHVRPHYYMEKNYRNFSLEKYQNAWRKACLRHKNEWAIVTSQGALQAIPDAEPIKINIIDLIGESPELINTRLQQTRQNMMRAELPLDQWPWVDVRVSVWQEGEDVNARLHYNHNNFFADGGGTHRFLQEIEQYYLNESLVLPAIDLTLRDALIYLDKLAQTDAGQKDKAYWESCLADLPPPPELPLRAGMNRRCRSQLKRREFFLDAATWSAFKRNAQNAGLTPSNAVFACYAEIISAWSNQDQFVLSNMVTRRLPFHQDIRDIMGNFASLYPLNIDWRPQKNFTERALKLQQQVVKDTQHLRWGGIEVMQALNRLQDGFGRAPIPFVIGSGLFMQGFERPDFSCLETSQVMLDHQFWELNDGRYYYVWDGLEEFFPEGMITAMSDAYRQLLIRLAESQGLWRQHVISVVPNSQLDMRQALNSMSVARPAQRLESFLHQLLVTRAGGRQYGFADIDQNSEIIAKQLIHTGVKPGALVGVVMPRCAELIAVVLGILRSGAAYVPIDASLPYARRAYLLAHSQAQQVITTAALSEALQWPEGVKVYTHESLAESPLLESVALPRTLSHEDLAYVIYTSGSTGQPKGVMIDHGAVLNTVLDINDRFQVTAKDVIFGVSSFSFDLSVYDLFGALHSGATLVYPDEDETLNTRHWLELIETEGVTIWNSAPPLALLLLEEAERQSCINHSMRLILLSGDWIPLALPDRLRAVFPNAKIVSLGGATEASIWSIIYEIGEVHNDWNSIPYGRPMLNQSWTIVDEALRETPVWSTGELCIGGAGLAQGYWRDMDKTNASFILNPNTGERMYRTGDLGRYRPDGTIELLGRKDSQVKIQGHRIELGEIENALNARDSIQASLVVAKKGEGSVQSYLLAYVMSEHDSEDAIKEDLSQQLPEYMIPRQIIQLSHWPLTPNGKIDRKALPEPSDIHSKNSRKEVIAAKTETEKSLLSIWQTLLKHEALGIHHDFFDLGGDSFQAIQLIGNIRDQFGSSLSLGTLWQYRTIAALAAYIDGHRYQKERHRKRQGSLLLAMNQQSSDLPLYLIHPAGGNVLCYQALSAALNREVWALQAPGLDGESTPLASIPEFSQAYLPEILNTYKGRPIVLGGWSSGALIAYDLARQLEASNVTVAGIVMIDSPAPLVHTRVDEASLLQWFITDLHLPPTLTAKILRQNAVSVSVDKALEGSAQLMQQDKVKLGEDAEHLKLIYRVFAGIVRASRRYHAQQLYPQHCTTNILLFRARDGLVNEFSSHPYADHDAWGWQTLSSGQLSCHSLPANHYTVFEPDSLSIMVSTINRWFDLSMTG